MKVSVDGFEATLQEIHQEENPTILDDELPGAFADWITYFSYREIQEMAETYCYQMGEHKEWRRIADEYWTRNFGSLPNKYQPELIPEPIPSPMATAQIIKRYIENGYDVELDDVDVFFIRGLINERDVNKQKETIVFDAAEHTSDKLQTEVKGYCIDGKCYELDK